MNRKERGELSELAFIYKATGLGFHVSKPYGDSSPYDFVVEHLGRLSKVQVKSASVMHNHIGSYKIAPQHRRSGKDSVYCASDVDYFAFHIVPEDVWYVVPFAVVGSSRHVLFYPIQPSLDRRFGCYREAWHLLEGFARSADPLLTFNIDACDESVVLAP